MATADRHNRLANKKRVPHRPAVRLRPGYGLALLLISICFSFLEPSGASAAGLANSPWPTLNLNAQRTGNSPRSGPYAAVERWNYRAGAGAFYSSPAVAADGTIYFGSDDGAVNAVKSNGTFLWRYPTGGAVRSSPTIGSDGTIYVGSTDNFLYALNPNGTLKWRTGVGADINSSPMIADDGTIYAGTSTSLLAINPDGTPKWAKILGAEVGKGVTLGLDETIYFGTNTTATPNFYALYANGAEKWTANLAYAASSAPVATSDTVYINSGTMSAGSLYAFNLNGTEKWQYSGGSGGGAPAIGNDGTAYFRDMRGNLRAVLPSGSLTWFASVSASGSANPIIDQDGTIFFTGGSKVYAYGADRLQRWSFETNRGAAVEIFDSMAMGADGTLYVADSRGFLYAIGELPGPTNLVATSTESGIGLSWSPAVSPNIAGYYVYRSLTRGGPYSKISPLLGSTGYFNSGLPVGLPFYYVVKTAALNATGESTPSNEASGARLDLTPPFTTFATNPASPNGSNGWFKTVPTIGLARNEAGTTYYQWDSTAAAGWTAYSGTFNGKPGQSTLYYFSADTYGNTETVRSQVLKIDTKPPAAFDLLSPPHNWSAPKSPSLSWLASSDTVSGLGKYQLYIDGLLNKDNITTSTTSAKPSTLLTLGKHSWSVRAIDVAGNETNSNATWNVIVETTPPVTTLTVSSAPDARTGWYTITPSITLTPDETAATYYQWDSTTFSRWTGYSASFGAIDGSHTLNYYSVDPAGNTEAIKTKGFKVDTQPPEPFTPATPGNGSWTTQTAPTFSWNAATDTASGVAAYQLIIDGGSTGFLSPAQTSYTPGSALAYGEHTWFVNARDMVGNLRSSATFGLSVLAPESTPPVTTAILPPVDGTNGWYKTAPAISLSRDESGTTFYQLDSTTTTWTGYSQPFTAPEGPHTLYYRSVDLQGNTETVRSLPVWVDSGSPSTSTLSGAPGGGDRIDLAWNPAADAVSGPAGYNIYDGDTDSLVASTTAEAYSAAGLAAGATYRYYVRAFDNAGNLSLPGNTIAVTLSSDTLPPSAPKVVAFKASSTAIGLYWPVCQDNVGVSGYSIYNSLTDSLITTTAANSFLHQGLTLGNTYGYYVKAYDSAGNYSTAGNAVVLTLGNDRADSGPGVATATVGPNPNVSVTFADIVADGTVTVTQNADPEHDAPSGFRFAGTQYDITTTAGFTPPITVAIRYNEAEVGDEAALALFHWEAGSWLDVTLYVDTENNVIIGRTNSLSPFILGGPVAPATGVNTIALLALAVALTGAGLIPLLSWDKSVAADVRSNYN